MDKQQKGFTLIELVIVITIIAILAAIALPRYIALQADARSAKLQAAAGSVKAAAALVKALCMSQTGTGSTTFLIGGAGGGGCNAAPGATVGVIMDGAPVLTGFAYPTATAAGIQAAAQLQISDYTLTFAAGPPATMTVQPIGASAPGTCEFIYTWDPVLNSAPGVSVPSIAGC